MISATRGAFGSSQVGFELLQLDGEGGGIEGLR